MSDWNRAHTRYWGIGLYHSFGLHNIPFVFKMFSVLTCIQNFIDPLCLHSSGLSFITTSYVQLRSVAVIQFTYVTHWEIQVFR